MNHDISLDEFLAEFSSCYDKINISTILLKNKNENQWYCVKLKITFLRNMDKLEERDFQHLDYNKNFVNIYSFEIPINESNILLRDLRQRRISINNSYIEIFSFESFTDRLTYLKLDELDSYCKDFYGLLFNGYSNKGFFPAIINLFSIKESDLGIGVDIFNSLLDIPSYNLFTQHTVLLICPLFVKEIDNDYDSIYKKYEIDETLYNKCDIKFYTVYEDLKEFLMIQYADDSFIIEIPRLEKKLDMRFEITSPLLANIVVDVQRINNSTFSSDHLDLKNIDSLDQQIGNFDKDILPLNPTTLVMGNIFYNSPIINNSNMENAFNKINDRNDVHVAIALKEIAKFIENSGEPSAGALFDKFTVELIEQQPDKNKLKSYWNGIVTILPLVTSLSNTIPKILSLFN